MGWLPRAATSAVLLPLAGAALGLASAALVATASAPDATAAPSGVHDRTTTSRADRTPSRRAALGSLKGAGPRAASGRLRVVRPRAGARISGRTRVAVASPRLTGVRRVDLKVGGRLIARLRPAGGVFTGAAGWLDGGALRNGRAAVAVIVHRTAGRVIVRRPVAVVGTTPSVRLKALRKDRTPPSANPRAATPTPRAPTTPKAPTTPTTPTPTAPAPPAPPADTAGPRLGITSPAAGAEVSGTVSVAADADDPSGVASVRFSVAGTAIGTDTTAPYAVSWTTTAADNGQRLITAVATDVEGNTSTATRSVTVANAAPPPSTPPPVTPPPSTPPPSGDALPGTLAWTGDFETNSLSQWSGVQRVANDRVQVVASPAAQGSRAARIEVRQGDFWQGSGGNRAELVQMTDERQGDERWYAWSTMFAPGYPSTTTGWQIFTQWHASAGGTQPTLVFYASGETIGFKTVESDASFKSKPSVVHWTGAIARGDWHHFKLHVKWSDTPATGWVELWHNGVQVVQRTPVAGRIPGQNLYLKQGLYRSEQIGPTGVLYHDAMRMTSVN